MFQGGTVAGTSRGRTQLWGELTHWFQGEEGACLNKGSRWRQASGRKVQRQLRRHGRSRGPRSRGQEDIRGYTLKAQIKYVTI